MQGRKIETNEWFSSRQKALPAGLYLAELMSVNPGIGKGYGKEQGERHTLMFSFREKKTGAVINRTVSRTNSERSQLVMLVKAMAGGNSPSGDVIKDPEAFRDFILSLVGKSFQVQIQPSGDGRYNNLIACFPAPEFA